MINRINRIKGVVLALAATAVWGVQQVQAQQSELKAGFGSMTRASMDDLIRRAPGEATSYIYLIGVKQAASGQREEAINAFRYILQQLDSLHAPSCYQLSRQLAGDPRAVAYAERAYRLDTTNNEYLRQYATGAYYTNNWSLAHDLFQRLTVREAGAAENYIALGLVAQRQGKPNLMVEMVDQYQSNWGFNPQLSEMKYEALTQMGSYPRALECISEMVENMPDVVDFRLERARTYLRLVQDSAAVADYRAAMAIDSTDSRVWVDLSEYYRVRRLVPEYVEAMMHVFRADDLSESGKADYFAESFFDPTLYPQFYFDIDRLALALYSRHPDSPKVRDVYIRFLMYVGRLDEAASMIEGIMEKGQASADDYASLIQIQMFRKQPEQAIQTSLRAAQVFPDDERNRLVESFALYEMKAPTSDILAALRRASKHIRSDSMKVIALTMTGDLYSQQGEHRKAFGYYRKSLRVQPDDAATLNNYAYLLATEDGDLEQALEMSERANERVTSNPTYLDTQAWILYKMGRYEQAREVMRRALALESQQSDVLFLHYGDILYAVGDYLMAKNYWRKALEAGYDSAQISSRIKMLDQRMEALKTATKKQETEHEAKGDKQ